MMLNNLRLLGAAATILLLCSFASAQIPPAPTPLAGGSFNVLNGSTGGNVVGTMAVAANGKTFVYTETNGAVHNGTLTPSVGGGYFYGFGGEIHGVLVWNAAMTRWDWVDSTFPFHTGWIQ